MNNLSRSLLSLFCIVLFSPIGIFAQATDSDGIKSFRSGNYNDAIQRLEKTEDPLELSFLAQAYEAVNRKSDAGKAYERSFKAGYAIFDNALVEWDASKPSSSFTKALVSLREIMSVSISSARSAVRLKARMARDNEWLAKASGLLAMEKLELADEEILHRDGVDLKVKINEMPRAAMAYTACHKENMRDVNVVLWAVFHADGRTISLIPRSKWNVGCNESAMKAAAKIRFEAATKGGKPVTTISGVEYTFSSQ